MKWRLSVAVITVLCVGLFCSFPALNNQAQAQGKRAVDPQMPKITVVNPLGTPPPIKLKNMAPRLDTLDGKTIYIVDDGFVGGDNLLLEMQDWFKANYPKTTIVFKRKGGGGFDVEDPALWAEMKEKANGIIIGLGHWSQCAPAVVGHSVNFETKMNIPAVPIVISEFYQQETEKARNEGLPGLRTEWIRGPVWAKTREELRRDVINGNSPISGKPVMQEIVDKFTKPLTAEEKKTGEIIRDKGPATFTDTPEKLQKLFMDNRWTDFLPVVLPTEALVNNMLKGTSHAPDEAAGKMSPTNTGTYFEYWTFTVKDVAVNAVMAGCKPEYLPLLLAAAATGKEAISVSDNSFVDMMVINGPIRDEIGLNSGVGAMGPYAHANTTIGRAWSLIAINLGNCGKVGTTYMGVVGNPMNLINIVIAENEKESPWEPFSVRKGFKKNENVLSIFEGWGVLSAANWKAASWGKVMDYPKIIKDIFDQQGFLFGAAAILSPPIANFVKNAGYATAQDFEKYLAPAPPQFPMAKTAPPAASPEAGAQAKAPAPKPKMQGRGGSSMPIIVTGGTNNNYYSLGGMRYLQSVQIDKWR